MRLEWGNGMGGGQISMIAPLMAKIAKKRPKKRMISDVLKVI